MERKEIFCCAPVNQENDAATHIDGIYDGQLKLQVCKLACTLFNRLVRTSVTLVVQLGIVTQPTPLTH